MLSETFESIADFAYRAEENPRHQQAYDASVMSSPENTNGMDYERAMECARNGGAWIEGAQNLARIQFNTDIDTTEIKREFFTSPVGFMPNVPAAINGLPDSMINSRRAPKPFKRLTICVNVSKSHRVTDQEALNRGRAILSLIEALELGGFSVELWAYIGIARAYDDISPIAEGFIKIKGTNEAVNYPATAFAFCSNAILRRVWFRYIEGSELWDLSNHNHGYPRDANNEKQAQFDVYFLSMTESAIWLNANSARDAIVKMAAAQLKKRAQ